MNLPTLKQLRYLLALKETLHFGHAAEKCFVTQSTLSAGLAELETLLDAKLVERTRRSVMFTPLGDQVAAKARRVLAEAEGLVDLTMAAQTPLSGIVRMGVIPTIAPFLLPSMMPPLRRIYPDLKLHLTEAVSHDLCDSLHHGVLDVVLFALPFRCGEVEQEILFDDPFLAAFPSGPDPLPDRIDVTELDRDRLLLLEDGHCLRDHALAACSMTGMDPGRSILGTSLHTLVQMVDNGLGITLLPELAIRGGLLRGTSVRTVPLEDGTSSRKIGLVWRKSSPRSQEFRLLADFLRG